ncbi:MAG TPA: PaaI family thioesterase [Methylomirabilota bacterium]|jgi:uncharacterized protein (TIGR00369 family)
MPSFAVQDPHFEASVRRSFDSLTLMGTVGAQLRSVAPGAVEIDLPFRADLTQHHGYIAAAVLTAIVDVACGYAAMTLMPAGASVLTIEYKVNFLSPAQGERMVARGKVVRPGRTVTVCAGDVVAIAEGTGKIVATMLATMATVAPRVPQPATSVTHEDELSAHPRGPSGHSKQWCVCKTGAVRRLREMVSPRR